MCWTSVRVCESCPRPRMVLQSYDLEYSSNNVSGSRKRIVIAVVVMLWQANWSWRRCSSPRMWFMSFSLLHRSFPGSGRQQPSPGVSGRPGGQVSGVRDTAPCPRIRILFGRWRCSSQSRCACFCICRASLDAWDARISALVLGELSGCLGRVRSFADVSPILTGHTLGVRSTLPGQVDVLTLQP